MTALARSASALPASLLDTLQALDGGYIQISDTPSSYVPGPNTIRRLAVHNLGFISVEDLAVDNERPLHVIGHLVDHYLGCAGEVEGRWLSDGGGISLRLQQAAARLPRLYALGYGVDEVAQSDVRDYFAQSLAVYCREPRQLNVADPQIHKWFRSTLWNQGFWSGMEIKILEEA
jgi:hypothetical protein